VRFTGVEHVVTGDELWFFLYHPHDPIWASSQFEMPERFSPQIDTEKCRISFLWSVNGIRSLVDVPKCNTYNSAFFCDTVVPSLFDGITLNSRRKSLKGLSIPWTMHVCMIQGNPLNVFTQERPSWYRTRLTARTAHQVTSSSLVISSENSPNTTSLTGRA
jgi:hypothetical protein